MRDPEDRRPASGLETLKTLRRLCRFLARYRFRDGSFLLPQDPTRGLALPSKKNPARPRPPGASAPAGAGLADDERYERMLEVAHQVHPYMRTLLVLAGETGRRIGAIVALRYSDWLPDQGTHGSLRWRAEEDKLGKERTAPVSQAVREELQRVLQERPGIGDAYLFPAPKSQGHIEVPLTSRWWRRAEEKAGLTHLHRGGWHMLRRRWATKRKGMNVRDVAYVGGWKGTQVLQQIYQQPDIETMEDVVSGGRELRQA